MQEKFVKMAECSEELCDWDMFKEKYACAVECPFEEMCRYESDSEFCALQYKYSLNRAAAFVGGHIDLILLIASLTVLKSS